MRASVHVDLPGYTKEGLPALKARCEELAVQPRGTRGESGGQTGQDFSRTFQAFEFRSFACENIHLRIFLEHVKPLNSKVSPVNY